MIDFTNVMKDKTDYLEIEEIDKMLQYCYHKGKTRDYMLILTLQRTARRVTEIVGERPYTKKVGLRPVDIHGDLIEFDILKKNHIKTKTKGGQERSPERVMTERLNKMPKRALKAVDDEYLGLLKGYIESNNIASHERVFPITRQRVDRIVKTVAAGCGIVRSKKGIHSHNFRHSLAIHLLKDNPNDAGIIKQVQDLLDHSDINVTMGYAQFTQHDKKDSLNKLFEV